tara:strand:- start:801 stop:1319 length:519 start_codon:yes stop_codon:yes gene_type:complete
MLTITLLYLNTIFAFNSNNKVFQNRNIRCFKYVPSGLSPEEWDKIKQTDKQNSIKGLNGPRGYKSRSMNDFVKALEEGKAQHLMPVDPRKVKSGEIKPKDVPYMQRKNGAWDDSDLKITSKFTNVLNKFVERFRNSNNDNDNKPKTDQELWKDAGAISVKEARRMKIDKIDS